MTVANPYETIEPRSGSEALADTTRYMSQLIPRKQVIELVRTMRPAKIMDAIKGLPVEPPLNPVEAQLAITVDHYRGLMGFSIAAVALLEGLRQEVFDGGVFVGEPLPDSHYTVQAV